MTVERPPPANAEPRAAFISTCAGLEWTFADVSTDAEGPLAAWAWSFGDGSTSTAQHPTRRYAASGTYTVTLTVTDAAGATSTAVESGAPIYRIGSTAGAMINLEDGNNVGLAGWGWQDNGFGVGVLGPVVYFATTGQQRLRIQAREDGLGLDQVVLSAQQYLTSAPGALNNDTTVLPR